MICSSTQRLNHSFPKIKRNWNLAITFRMKVKIHTLRVWWFDTPLHPRSEKGCYFFLWKALEQTSSRSTDSLVIVVYFQLRHSYLIIKGVSVTEILYEFIIFVIMYYIYLCHTHLMHFDCLCGWASHTKVNLNYYEIKFKLECLWIFDLLLSKYFFDYSVWTKVGWLSGCWKNNKCDDKILAD